MQAMTLAAISLPLEEERKCSQMNKVDEFVKECQVVYSQGKAMYRRHSSDLLERNQLSKDKTSDGTKAVKMSFWRRHDVELKVKLWTKIFQTTVRIVTTGYVRETQEWMQWHKLSLKGTLN